MFPPVNEWNKSSTYCINASSVNMFKKNLQISEVTFFWASMSTCRLGLALDDNLIKS